MRLNTEIFRKAYWQEYEEAAHRELFGEDYIEEAKDYDLVILVTTEDGEKFFYSTVKELDSQSAYMNFGGMFKLFRGKGGGQRGFHEVVCCLKERYKRIGFTCRTKNFPMIKLGLNEGFVIIGMRLVYGFPNLEFLLERGI